MSKKYIIIVGLISSILLILAITDLPYGYYTLLRWIITCSSIFYIFISASYNIVSTLILHAIIGILFNPIIPVYLSREIWLPIDIIVGFIYLISMIILAIKIKKDET